ncbi:AfsA-related hotdog domain-containing protein [Kitasatospora sp. NBC_01287]|uniref:AfsA-related hotdog domain-containing protein n=1 Tax=Kitasatospora sp. NBC_01287 TaxID=2903573 RepID=UPI002250727F|nr:AfsA-related hotdog domain-containing protein [Kitasatospora sp. NBC_01287]MCX4750345.1 AfsA-related hotdog domain-containing protein [Kitasatospora sp. NBC_01287]
MTVHSETTPVRQPQDEEGARHLIHCPSSWEHYLLDAPSLGEEHFVLVGDLPVRHPLFNDGPGHFHDAQLATEAVTEIGAFVGHRYFGVPEDRTGLFHRFTLQLTELSAWRADSGASGGFRDGVPRIATEITAIPTNIMNEVPRCLELRLEIRIDDILCGRGSAGLIFLMPKLYRKHLATSRRVLREAPELADLPEGRPRPARPIEVGRSRPENVVVSEPAADARGRLSTWLLTEGVSPVVAGLQGELTGLHLLEALRQTAVLAAGRTAGLDPARCTLAASEVDFRAQAALDLPLRCLAVPGPRTHDGHGRPAVPVTLTVTQHRRAVAEARLTVVQDL